MAFGGHTENRVVQYPRKSGRRASPEHSFLALTNCDLEGRGPNPPRLEAYVGPGPSAVRPIPGWDRLPSGQGSDDLQLHTPRVFEENERYTGTEVALDHVE